MAEARAWARRYQRPIMSTKMYINKVLAPSMAKLKIKKLKTACACFLWNNF